MGGWGNCVAFPIIATAIFAGPSATVILKALPVTCGNMMIKSSLVSGECALLAANQLVPPSVLYQARTVAPLVARLWPHIPIQSADLVAGRILLIRVRAPVPRQVL